MSIFDRIISSLSGSEAAEPAAPAAPVAPRAPRGSRFMGKDEEDAAAPVEEPGFEEPSEIWLYLAPTSQLLRWVPELGVAEGRDLTTRMNAQLQRLGWCEEVSYHAGYDQYWKMPSQESIVRMPGLYGIAMPLANRVKVTTQLVRQGEPRGFWMHVRVRAAGELPAAAEEPQV